MSTFNCPTCGPTGLPDNAPHIALHNAVSHGTGVPIVAA